MKFYFAPMEGITGYVFRNAHHACFPSVDRYYTPFISPNQNRPMSPKEKRDVLPENNRNIPLIPQILTNNAIQFLQAAKVLADMGYEEVNLNLGCPSGTVVAKKRGAGFLSVPDELDEFFAQIYENELLADKKVKLSVKTRLGMEEPEEFDQLLDIYNRYPFEELILHPRVQKDYYKNKPRLEYFEKALEKSTNPVCYNGDLFTIADYRRFKERFPSADRVMIGRGFIGNPALIEQIAAEESRTATTHEDTARLRQFHDRIYHEYLKIMSGDKNTIHKMKELWFYQKPYFDNADKAFKKIRKSRNMAEYEAAVQEFFAQAVPTERDTVQFTK